MYTQGTSALKGTALEDFIKRNEEIFKKHKNLVSTLNEKTGNYYLKYVPQSIDNLINDLKSAHIQKKFITENINKYGYAAETKYILNSLGLEDKSRKRIKVNKSIEEQAEIFKFIFDTNRDCFVRIRNKSTGQYRAYPVAALKDKYKLQAILKSNYFTNMNDMMYSLNTYNNMYHADEASIFSLHLIAIDVDFDKNIDLANKEPEEVLALLKTEYIDNIPPPNLIEWGHRIRLLYKIECVGATNKSIKIVQLVTSALAKKLENYGATGQAVTTYGRIINSINTRNNHRINLILFNSPPYILRDLQEKLLDKPKWLQRIYKANKDTNLIKLNTTYTLNIERVHDLEKIQNIRQEGYREILCYLYRNYCLLANMTKEEAKNAMLKFNSSFINPLKMNVVEQDTRALERKQYLHKNKTILDLLDINPEDEIELGLKTIISDKEKKRRNNEYNKYKYRQGINKYKHEIIKEENEKIISLRQQGLKNKEICTLLNINIKTLERRITKMIKDGLL